MADEKYEIDAKLMHLQVAKRHEEQLERDAAGPGPVNRFGPTKGAIADAIYDALLGGVPLHRRELLDYVLQQGLKVNSAKPLNYISFILSMDARFVSTPMKDGFWQLSERALEELKASKNEAAEGCSPSAASDTKREGCSQMAQNNNTIESDRRNRPHYKESSIHFNLGEFLGPREPEPQDLGRQQQGVVIASFPSIKANKDGFSVRSQTSNGSYQVTIDDEGVLRCSCLDFESRNAACKHIYAVKITMAEEDPDEELPTWAQKAVESPPVKRPTYRQNWAAYNKAQVNEKAVFGVLLQELCATIPPLPRKKGRPPIPLADMVQAICIKTYTTASGRRAMTDVQQAATNGLLDNVPSWPSLLRYMEKPELTPLLNDLIQRSALPLQDVEVDFASDSSGFSTSVYDRWFDHKWGREIKTAHFVKAHITCGVITNIITAAKVTAGQSSDSRQLPEMVKTTARNFTINEFSADKAYLSRENLHAIQDAGGVPYIPFKVNSTSHHGHHRRDSLWEKMYHYFNLRRDDFLKSYHKRSNVETTFHMVKKKLGGYVRSKTPTAQVNEVLAKLLCHNVIVLVHEMYELGIQPTWSAGEEESQLAA